MNIYPVKSMSGVTVNTTEITPTGLKNDRVLAICKTDVSDPAKKWISLRERPDLYLFKVNLLGSLLRIGHRNCNEIVEVDLQKVDQIATEQLELSVWEDRVLTEVIGGEVNEFISEMLGTSVQMVSYVSRVISRERYKVFPDSPTIQDGFPISVANRASLRALNDSLKSSGYSQASMKQFRANIVIDSGIPFDENNAKGIRIDGQKDLIFKEGIPRCVITQIDSESGTKRSDQPVVRTLSQVNNIGRPDDDTKKKPRFAIGAYPSPEIIGTSIQVGNRVDFI